MIPWAPLFQEPPSDVTVDASVRGNYAGSAASSSIYCLVSLKSTQLFDIMTSWPTPRRVLATKGEVIKILNILSKHNLWLNPKKRKFLNYKVEDLRLDCIAYSIIGFVWN